MSACSLRSQNAGQAIQPTQLTCGGWALHLAEVQKSENSGWEYITGYIALENVNAKPSIDFTSNNLHQLFDGLEVTTKEGYKYPIDNWDFGGAWKWVPPAFRYRLYIGGFSTFSSEINFHAAVGTTGRRVRTRCGTLDFDNPEITLQYPTDLPASSFISIGEPIQLSDGTLTITSYVMGDDVECVSGISSTDCLHIRFTNASEGYEANPIISLIIIDSDGVIHIPGISGDSNIYTGPGQTTEHAFPFGVSKMGNLKLIIVEGNQYWIVNLD